MMQQVTCTGADNLYALAAKYLGDATQWLRIGQQNGIADPMLANVIPADQTLTLTIPEPDRSQTGGVPAQ
jgi:hypothetical protein